MYCTLEFSSYVWSSSKHSKSLSYCDSCNSFSIFVTQATKFSSRFCRFSRIVLKYCHHLTIVCIFCTISFVVDLIHNFIGFFFSNAFIRSTYHAFSLPSSLEHQVSNSFFVTSKPIFTLLQNLRYFVTVSVVSFVLPYFQTCHKEVVNTGLR